MGVQSVVETLGVYIYGDSSCTPPGQYNDIYSLICGVTPCEQLTCDEVYAITPFMPQLPNGDECKYTVTALISADMLLVCEDDGTAKPSCEGYDLCVEDCFGGSGACVEPCVQYGVNMNTRGMGFDATGFADCDAICSANPYGFEYWGQCFNNSDTLRGTTLTCNMADSTNTNCTNMTSSSASDDSNTGVIVGIVIGAVVVVVLIVAVVMYLKKSKKAL